LCKEGRPCRRLAAVPDSGGVSGLLEAVDAEFAGGGDETVRQLALKLAELADQPGPQSVAACRALGELIDAKRRPDAGPQEVSGRRRGRS
jgi:hypothetical protein